MGPVRQPTVAHMVKEGLKLAGHAQHIAWRIQDHQIRFLNCPDHRLDFLGMGALELAFGKTITTTDTGWRGIARHEKLNDFRIFIGQFIQEELGDIIGTTLMVLSM